MFCAPIVLPLKIAAVLADQKSKAWVVGWTNKNKRDRKKKYTAKRTSQSGSVSCSPNFRVGAVSRFLSALEAVAKNSSSKNYAKRICVRCYQSLKEIVRVHEGRTWTKEIGVSTDSFMLATRSRGNALESRGLTLGFGKTAWTDP